MLSFLSRCAVLCTTAILISACSGSKNSALAQQCNNGLNSAYSELDIAEAEGFSGSVDWTKAASLLTAAKVQYEFEHYPNCIEKVGRARAYIRQSKGG